MHSDNKRLQTAQWVLERNLAWVAAAEVKVGTVVVIDTAMLGSLSAAFSTKSGDTLTCLAWLCAVGTAFALSCALLCAAMAVLPRVDGPEKSLLFFGRVGKYSEIDYVEHFKSASDKELLEDCIAQTHRNAQIACVKFYWIRKSMWCSFLSVAPWLASIFLLLQK